MNMKACGQTHKGGENTLVMGTETRGGSRDAQTRSSSILINHFQEAHQHGPCEPGLISRVVCLPTAMSLYNWNLRGLSCIILYNTKCIIQHSDSQGFVALK